MLIVKLLLNKFHAWKFSTMLNWIINWILSYWVTIFTPHFSKIILPSMQMSLKQSLPLTILWCMTLNSINTQSQYRSWKFVLWGSSSKFGNISWVNQEEISWQTLSVQKLFPDPKAPSLQNWTPCILQPATNGLIDNNMKILGAYKNRTQILKK